MSCMKMDDVVMIRSSEPIHSRVLYRGQCWTKSDESPVALCHCSATRGKWSERADRDSYPKHETYWVMFGSIRIENVAHQCRHLAIITFYTDHLSIDNNLQSRSLTLFPLFVDRF